MHAQVDNDQPLDSYLGFKEFGKNTGRLTVEDLLDSKLRKGSLVFLASCDEQRFEWRGSCKPRMGHDGRRGNNGDLRSMGSERQINWDIL